MKKDEKMTKMSKDELRALNAQLEAKIKLIGVLAQHNELDAIKTMLGV